MNNLYPAARGACIMRSINIASHRLNTKQINLTTDEFNYGYHANTTTK